MEKPSEETKFCSNCRRDIATSNYLMHTMHCQRNLKLCERCDEPIPRNELDQHMQELHSQVPCGKCSAIVECCKLEDHMRTACTKRTIKCSFCDLECILDEMKTHESYCGSRTEICSFCGQYVMIKEMEEHERGNCAKVTAKKYSEGNKIDALNNLRTKERTSGSNYRVPAVDTDSTEVQPRMWNYQQNMTSEADTTSPDISSDINQSSLDEQLALDLAREDLESLQASQLGELWEQSFDDETVPPYPRTLIPTMLGERAVIPGYNNDEFIIPVVDSIPDILSNVGTTQVESDEVELPCEFCGELYPSEVLIQHQSGCNPEAAHGTTVKSFRDENSEPNKTQSVLKEKNLHEDADTIPCEFCNECFSSDYLIQHESQCRPDIAHGPPPWSRKDKQLSDKPSVISTYPDNPSIPCEFCGELFPHHLLIDHQATCDTNTLEPILSDELYPSIGEDTVDRKQRTLKHQEDPQLEDITSMATSNAFAKERDILPASNKKPIQVIEIEKSLGKELGTTSETNRHSYSQSKSLCDNKRKNVATSFPNVDSYFERERNYHRLQKDKSLEEIFRRVPNYRSLPDTSPQSRTPFSERDSHFYTERLHYRDNWSSIPAGARPKNCPDTSVQDSLHSAVPLSRGPCSIDTQPKPKFSSRMAATLPPPLSENFSRDMRDVRPQEYSARHACLQPSSQLSGNDAGKSKSMKRNGMELHRR